MSLPLLVLLLSFSTATLSSQDFNLLSTALGAASFKTDVVMASSTDVTGVNLEPVVDARVLATTTTSTYINNLADKIITCESNGRNVEILDVNGKMSRGIAQFQDSTWEWLSGLAGVTGSSLEPDKARLVLVWALEHGYGPHWGCYYKVI